MPNSTQAKWPNGFWNLMFTQFQGAFSDNALKWLVIFPVLASPILLDTEKDAFASQASVMFAVPFLLFSTVGGWLADHFSKRSVMIGVKSVEIGIMLFATLGLYLENQSLQLAAICLMGVHSTIFAPAKYGIMPEVLPASQLSSANGILELLTFIGIILGTFTGGWLAEHLGHQQIASGMILTGLAVAGLITSLNIPRVPASGSCQPFQINIIRVIWNQMKLMKSDKDLWRANWGNSAFFFVAALLQLNLALYAQKHFHLKPTEQAGLQAALSLGIGLGSVIAGKLSRGKIEYGLIPIGALLMASSAFALGFDTLTKTPFTIILGLLGIGCGLFIVPIVSVLQHRPSPETKGAVQGAASWLSWVSIALAAQLLSQLTKHFHFSYSQIFWVGSAISLTAGIYVASTRPHAVKTMIDGWRTPPNP